MTDSIIIKGIDRVSSQADKGWCEELINARPMGSGLKLEQPRKEVSANLDIENITIHNIDGIDHFIGIKDGYICEFNPTTGAIVQKIYEIALGSDISFCCMDNLLMISNKTEINTIIYAYRDNNYILFVDNFNFDISPNIEMADAEGIVVKYNSPDQHVIDNDKYERINAIGEYSKTVPPPKEQVAEAVSAAINKMLSDNKTWCIGTFIYAFTVTLWDDKEYPISGIRVLSTVNSSFPYGHKYQFSVNGSTYFYTKGFAFSNVAITTDDGRKLPEGGCEARLYKEAMYIQEVNLNIPKLTLDTLEKYKEVIKRVNLYVSKPVLPWRLEGKYLDYEFKDTTDFQKLKFVFADVDLEEDGVMNSQMFLNKSWDFQELKEDISYKLEFVGDEQTTENTMPVLDSTLRAGDMFVYNKRVHLYNTINKMRLYDKPIMDSSDISNDVFNVSNVAMKYSKHLIGSMSAYVHYRLNTEERVVRYDGLLAYALAATSGITADDSVIDYPYDKPIDITIPEDASRTTQLSLRPFVVVPDARAYKIDFIIDDGSYILSLDLKPSSSYDFAYCYIQPYNGFCNYLYKDGKYGYEHTNMSENKGALPSYTNDMSYKSETSISVSEQANPIVYPAINNYNFDGNILGLSIMTEKVSDTQIGAYPLAVFTTKGIYLLEQGQGSVLYSNITPINTDVIEGDLLQTRLGIVYCANGNIYLLSGRKAINISYPLNGEVERYLHSASSYNIAAKNEDYINVAKYICTIPFREYIIGCKLSYSPYEEDIIVSNPNYRYSFVYNITSRMWHKISDTYLGYIGANYNLKRLTADDAQATSASAIIQITGLNVDMEAMMVAKSHCSFGDIVCNAGDRIDLVIDGQQQASINFTYATKTNLVIETLLNEIEGVKLIVEDNKYVLYFAEDLSAKTCRIVNITRNIIFECSEGLIQTLTPHQVTIPQKGIGETIIFGVGSSTTTHTLTIKQGDTPESISSSIAAMLNGKAGINATSYGNTVVVTAIVPGKQGNNISLGFNTPNNMQINNNDMFVFLSGGEEAGVLEGNYVRIVDYSLKAIGKKLYHIETRAFALQAGTYTLVQRLICDCRMQLGMHEYLNLYLFTSDNKMTWICSAAAQVTNCSINTLRTNRAARAHKYYTIVINGLATIDGYNEITNLLCQYQDVFNNKLR